MHTNIAAVVNLAGLLPRIPNPGTIGNRRPLGDVDELRGGRAVGWRIAAFQPKGGRNKWLEDYLARRWL